MPKSQPTERLFAAILLPPSWTEAIACFQHRLMRRYGDAVRWVDPKTYHITVRFFGTIETQLAKNLIAEWQELPCILQQPLIVAPGIGGCFPSEEQPRVVWAGATVPDTSWIPLLRHIDRLLSALGIQYPISESTPHITLGRVKEPQKVANLREHCTVPVAELAPFEATHLDLMISRQTHAGNRYFSVARHRLSSCL